LILFVAFVSNPYVTSPDLFALSFARAICDHGRMQTKTNDHEPRYCRNHLERLLLPGDEVCSLCQAAFEGTEWLELLGQFRVSDAFFQSLTDVNNHHNNIAKVPRGVYSVIAVSDDAGNFIRLQLQWPEKEKAAK
jgi:hypothetical protein